MAKQASRTPRAASLSEEQRALATAIITDAIVAARQNVAAPPQVPALAPVSQIPAVDKLAIDAAAEYVNIKFALRTHSEAAPTSTTLTASPPSSKVNVTVEFTATVTPSSAITPTGTVTFMDGATTLPGGTITLVSKQAIFRPSFAVAGTHSITAVYGGDSNFTGSTSVLDYPVTT
jgi:Bacterial Ig-like domain (group 3)